MRDGLERDVSAEEVVPGDICVLNAGDIIPGDAAILESKDLFVDEAALTGESFPAEKETGIVAKGSQLMKRTNSLFMGTHVISGSARALVVFTGASTEFGKVSERLRLKPAETEFEHGVRRFGYLLTEVTLVLVIVIFGITVYLERPVIDSFLFALAIAVGIIPELLPAIIGINLAVGAVHMASRKVIVKQLASIENLGSMNVLCADKTGTLTEGTVKLQEAQDAEGKPSEKALFYAYLNSIYETGFTNPIDEAVRTHRQFDLMGYEKVDEVPYDFVRKRLRILVAKDIHSADVGISVNSAADVAKQAATIVLLEKHLGVLSAGVREVRRTFANTLKYIYMTTSANFGNMFSMAGAALFLPFLPLLPKQILLNNFLTDFPAIAISTDAVDPELVEKPRSWNIRFIRNFMIVFGVVSSIFDFLTFAALVFILKATPEQFRTGWFVESVMTEVLIIIVMRTWKPFYKSRPSRPLLVAMILVLLVTLALPYSPLKGILGLTPLPVSSLLLLGLITVLYAGVSELTKKIFHARAFGNEATSFSGGLCSPGQV